MSALSIPSYDRTERNLLILAGAYLAVYSLTLTLSNAVRLRSWQVDYRWGHWLGLVIWIAAAWVIHRQLSLHLPERDPYLFPLASLLTGWGLLTVWRLSSGLGLRQSAWFLLIGFLLILLIHFNLNQTGDRILSYLRRFKYVWLTSGLFLTAATLVLGTNPQGVGPRLWLGCCGIYFQPSEPLKLLLIVYLAAYLADRQALINPPAKLLPLLTPTLLMTGLALLLLVFQRDLGTAAIFLGLYAVIIFAGTGDRRVLLVSLFVMVLAAVLGYLLFDVVRVRMEAWVNPWLDPSGRSYQIVQSLLSVANGGLIGRGPGMGSPSLVPIAQSDFIFSAISEEGGLLGGLGLLGLLALLVNRGMRAVLQSADPFRRLLAIGLTMHLVGQSILIIAGNLRLLPLTGVTLPFVSYGGSSLLVSYFELLCLLLISAQSEEVYSSKSINLKAQTQLSLFLSGILITGLAIVAMGVGWWSIVRGPNLLTRTDNPRRSIDDRYIQRGSILDRSKKPMSESTGVAGSYVRTYPYPALGPIVGYTHPIYGQAGLEASLDPYLRGIQGYPATMLWWQHLLYGLPPAGLDVRLSLDLDLQNQADTLLAGDPGAIVVMNAHTGEILTIASSPSFDAEQLDSIWQTLVNDPASPLFDRAGMGLYPAGNILGAFLLAGTNSQPELPTGSVDIQECPLLPSGSSFGSAMAAGCNLPLRSLVQSLTSQDLTSLLDKLGIYTAPDFPIETLSSAKPGAISDVFNYLTGREPDSNGDTLRVSPLQLAVAAAALSNAGLRPAPRLVMSVDTPQAGWVMLPETSQPVQVFVAADANRTASELSIGVLPIWELTSTIKEAGVASDAKPGYSWFIGGTLPYWQGAPLAIAVLLEENDPQRVQAIGHLLFMDSMLP